MSCVCTHVPHTHTYKILATFMYYNIKQDIRNEEPMIKRIRNDNTETKNKNNYEGSTGT